MRSLLAEEFAQKAGGFVLTEYCFAAEPRRSGSVDARLEASFQYLNKTPALIAEEIRDACSVVERATRSDRNGTSLRKQTN